MPPRLNETIEKRTFAVLVDNEPGVLHRVVGLFSARGYNIESLTVAETDAERPHLPHHHRHLRHAHDAGPDPGPAWKMVSVRDVQDVTRDPLGIERELALVKVRGTGEERAEALRLADIFRARVIDTTTRASSSNSPARPPRSTSSST